MIYIKTGARTNTLLVPVSLVLCAETSEASSASAAAAVPASKRPAVLADGTYATQSAVADTPVFVSSSSAVPNLRALLLGGDFFLGGVVAGTFVKLLLRYKALAGVSGEEDLRGRGYSRA